MEKMRINPDGQEGAGYLYQWYAVLYLINLLTIQKSKDHNSIIPDILSKAYFDFDKTFIKLTGNPQDFEDFELYNNNQNGSPINRILFQSKTFPENEAGILPSNRTFLDSIEHFIRKDKKNITHFVFVTNVGVKSKSNYSQTIPVALEKILNEDEFSTFENAYQARFGIIPSKQTLEKIFIWNTPKESHLILHLDAASSFNQQFASSDGLNRVMDGSTRKDGASFTLQSFIERAASHWSNDEIDHIQNEVNNRFLNRYKSNNILPLDDLYKFVEKHYVERNIDSVLDDVGKPLSTNIIVNLLDGCVTACDNINYKEGNNLESNSYILKYRHSINGLISTINSKSPLDDINKEMNDLFISSNGGLGTYRKLYKEEINEMTIRFNQAYSHIKKFRSTIIIFGVSGMGKTLSAIRYLIGLKWFLLFPFPSKTIDFDSIMANCANKCKVGTSNHDFINFIGYLQNNKGDGAILLDGVDECEDFSPKKLMDLLIELHTIRSANIRVIITCRTDYIDQLREELNPSDNQFRFINDLNLYAHSIVIPRMVENNAIIWIQKYCECYGLKHSIVNKALRSLGYRYTPRVLRHLFHTLREIANLGEHFPDELILADIVQYHSVYVHNECKNRLKSEISLVETIEGICEISKCFLKENITNDFLVREKYIIKSLDEKQRDIFKTLMHKCNEIELDNVFKGLFWRVPELPINSIANFYFSDNLKNITASQIQTLLVKISEVYGEYACEIIMYFFFLLNKAIQVGRIPLSKDFIDKEIQKITGKTYGRMAIQILNYQMSGKHIEEIDYSDDVFENVSLFSTYDFLTALSDSVHSLYKNGERDLVWCIGKFTAILFQCKDVYGDRFDYFVANDINKELFGKILIVSGEELSKNLAVLSYLGNVPAEFNVIESLIFNWAVDSVGQIKNLSNFDQLFYYLGTLKENEVRYRFAENAARIATNIHNFPEWIISDLSIYSYDINFYPRKCLINSLVKTLNGVEIKMIYELLKTNGDKEKRRNAVFIAQKYYLGDVRDRYRRLTSFLKDKDLEIISTAIGVIYADANSTRKHLIRPAKEQLDQLIHDENFQKLMYKKIEKSLINLEDINDFVNLLCDYRGIIEIVKKLQGLLLDKLESYDVKNLNKEKRYQLSYIIEAEEEMFFLSDIGNSILYFAENK